MKLQPYITALLMVPVIALSIWSTRSGATSLKPEATTHASVSLGGYKAKL